MTSLVALDSNTHRSLRVISNKAEEVGADLNMVPVVVSEFTKLVVQFPILFTKNSETGQFSCVSLLGLDEGENLFWQDARFNALYLPLHISRQPFFVGEDETGARDYLLCINQESDCLSEQSGERIFNDDGTPGNVLKQAQADLSQLLAGERQTLELVKYLVELNLLVPLTLEITLASGQTKKINGLYSVDEEKMKSLSAEQLFLLNTNGNLQAIYTHLASLSHIYSLIDLKNKKDADNPWFQ